MSSNASRGTAIYRGRNSISYGQLYQKRSSFTSVGRYYQFQDFCSSLSRRYRLNPFYFTRFYRHYEPLVTPTLLKLTVREPLSLTAQMYVALEDLESLLTDFQAGKAIDKKAVSARTREIRALAKKVRSNRSLSFVDQRENKNLTKGKGFEKLGLDAVVQLRGMVTDLHTQLESMNRQETTTTVSVANLSQPSLKSLSKGIEKLTKIIEKSAKRL